MKGSCIVITFMVPQFQTIKWNYAVNLFKVCSVIFNLPWGALKNSQQEIRVIRIMYTSIDLLTPYVQTRCLAYKQSNGNKIDPAGIPYQVSLIKAVWSGRNISQKKRLYIYICKKLGKGNKLRVTLLPSSFCINFEYFGYHKMFIEYATRTQ